MFRDRVDAGRQLAARLNEFANAEDTIIIGLPRGGIPVANEIANALQLPLDLVCPRKIGSPMNEEFAIGAITETGVGIFDYDTITGYNIPQSYIDKTVEREKKVAQARLKMYRQGKPPRDLEGKTVILVDDGLATGATMKAAIRSVISEGANRVVVAVPVSPQETLEEIRDLVDTVICLETPVHFQAVGQFYEDFRPTQDAEVIEIMKKTNQPPR